MLEEAANTAAVATIGDAVGKSWDVIASKPYTGLAHLSTCSANITHNVV
jgi:hypothetical protein